MYRVVEVPENGRKASDVILHGAATTVRHINTLKKAITGFSRCRLPLNTPKPSLGLGATTGSVEGNRVPGYVGFLAEMCEKKCEYV